MSVTIVSPHPKTFITAVTCQEIRGLPPTMAGALARISAPPGIDCYIHYTGTDGVTVPTDYSLLPGGAVGDYPIKNGRLFVSASGIGTATIDIIPVMS